jgi:hypothetical protein
MGGIHEELTAVLNWASKYSSCRSKTVSFSFKTASLLLVADSNCNKNSKRRRTLRERELEKWRLSQSDCTAIPTATVFIPALAIAGNFRSFPDFSWFTFLSSKAWLSQPKKAGIGLCCRDSRGFLSESLLFSAISTFVDFPISL